MKRVWLIMTILWLAIINCKKIKKENNPPTAPIISGPDSISVGESVTFTASAEDPDGDNVAIRFSWGDGDTSNWSSFVSSWQSVSMSHIYTGAGTYYITAQAKDTRNALSKWSSFHKIKIIGKNIPPNAPVVSGPNEAATDEYIYFTASALDPDSDSVAIRFAWGDGNTTKWSGYRSNNRKW